MSEDNLIPLNNQITKQQLEDGNLEEALLKFADSIVDLEWTRNSRANPDNSVHISSIDSLKSNPKIVIKSDSEKPEETSAVVTKFDLAVLKLKPVDGD